MIPSGWTVPAGARGENTLQAVMAGLHHLYTAWDLARARLQDRDRAQPASDHSADNAAARREFRPAWRGFRSTWPDLSRSEPPTEYEDLSAILHTLLDYSHRAAHR